MSEPLYQNLQSCLREQYGLTLVTLDKIHGGLDSDATVYRVATEQEDQYLLKLRSGAVYGPAYLVPHYLQQQGVVSVVAPLPTQNNALWTQFGDRAAIIYPFIKGDTSWTGMVDSQWKKLGMIFKQVHNVSLPSFDTLKKETFDTTAYAQWIRDFEADPIHSQNNKSEAVQNLCAVWKTHQSIIHTAIESLESLGAALQNRDLPNVLCHADLHPANILREEKTGRVHVIDWDETMLAPKERDFIFIREPYVDAFFQGYGGKAEIDWMVLAYYLWERVVQDVIAFSRDICLRDEWKEETKAENLKLLQRILAGSDGTIPAAHAAAGRQRCRLV